VRFMLSQSYSRRAISLWRYSRTPVANGLIRLRKRRSRHSSNAMRHRSPNRLRLLKTMATLWLQYCGGDSSNVGFPHFRGFAISRFIIGRKYPPKSTIYCAEIKLPDRYIYINSYGLSLCVLL
jgi:hypothetical protein